MRWLSLGLRAKLACGWVAVTLFCTIVCADDFLKTPRQPQVRFAGQVEPKQQPQAGARQPDRPILPHRFSEASQTPSIFLLAPILTNGDGNDAARVPPRDESGENTAGDRQSRVDADVESRLRALEETVAKSSSGNGPQSGEAFDSRLNYLEQTLGDVESDGAQFLESLSRESLRIFNGRLHLDSWDYPVSSPGINAIESGDFAIDPQNRLLVRRARIGVHGTVPPDNMSYRLDLEFSGQEGGRIRDAWLGWDDLPVLNTLRIGNQKRPYGLDHLNSSNFMTFLERPLVVDAFNRSNRRPGLVSYGASSDLERNWQFGVFNMVPIQGTNQIVGDKAQMEFAGRFAHTVWYDQTSDGRGYAHLAVAGTLAFPDGSTSANQSVFQTRPEARTNSSWLDTGQIPGADSYQLVALESVLNVGAFQAVGEWMNIQLQRIAGFGSDLQLNGGYVALSYFLTGEHIPWDRKLGTIGRVEPFTNFFCVNKCNDGKATGWGAWQAAVRLSRADFNDSDIRGGVGESLTLALNWYWNAHTRLQFNYILGRIDDRRTTLTNGMTPIVSGDYQIIGTRFMIDF